MKVPSRILMGIPHRASSSALSPFGDACFRRDLTAINEILDNIGYKDYQGVVNEVLYFILNLSTGFKSQMFNRIINCILFTNGLSAILFIFTFQAIIDYQSVFAVLI